MDSSRSVVFSEHSNAPRDASLSERRSFFDRLAPKRERDVGRHVAYYADRLRWLKRLIPENASVVELGCGTGPTLSQLPQRAKVGIDFSPEMIRIAKEHDPHSEYFVDDIENLTHRTQYDYILLLDTLNFLSNVQQGLSNIRTNLCRDESRLVITYYNFLWQPLFLLAQLFRWKTRFPEQNWLARSDVKNLLSLAGFEIILWGERMLLPIRLPLIASFFNRFLVSLPLFRAFALVKYVIARPIPEQLKAYSVTVLSAVRNERGNIQPIVDAMPMMGSATEILFVEGHSTDGTWEEIERVTETYVGPLTVRGMQQPGRGKADALHCGVRASGGEVLLIYDGDFTVHPSELKNIYEAIASGKAEFVNASRLIYPLREGAMRLLNLIGNRIFSALFSWLLSQKLVDVLSPVKAMLRRDYTAVLTRFDPFGDFDFFLGAAGRQLKMREVPVHYLKRTYGTTKIRRFRHAWLLLKLCYLGARKLKWT